MSGTTVLASLTTQDAFRNCAPFTKICRNIYKTTIDDAEDLYFAMPMYYLIGYNLNCSDMAGSLWFYSKDEAANFSADITNTDGFKYFRYKTKLLENTIAQPNPIQIKLIEF